MKGKITSDDIRKKLTDMRVALLNGNPPGAKQFVQVAHMFYERDNKNNGPDLELLAVTRGIDVGMTALSQVYTGFGLPDIKTSAEWMKDPEFSNLTIIDADGWDRQHYEWSFNQEYITIEVMRERLSMSTIRRETT